jgi:putative sterol carrier protein
MIRDDIEQAMQQKLQGAAPIGATILFDLGADGTIFLDGKTTPPAVTGSGEAPNATIAVAAEDLRDMMAGRLDPMEAFALGKIEIDGDMEAAMKLGSLLG